MTAIDQQPRKTEEPADLASLVHRYQAGVWRYVRFLGADTTEADDLTQETFLALARGGFVERDERQTAGYLRVVARNQLLALRRRQNREVSTVELEAADSVWAAAAGPDGSLTQLPRCASRLLRANRRPRPAGCRFALPRTCQPRSNRIPARHASRWREDTPPPHPRSACANASNEKSKTESTT